jgi:hypothetical protein
MYQPSKTATRTRKEKAAYGSSKELVTYKTQLVIPAHQVLAVRHKHLFSQLSQLLDPFSDAYQVPDSTSTGITTSHAFTGDHINSSIGTKSYPCVITSERTQNLTFFSPGLSNLGIFYQTWKWDTIVATGRFMRLCSDKLHWNNPPSNQVSIGCFSQLRGIRKVPDRNVLEESSNRLVHQEIQRRNLG